MVKFTVYLNRHVFVMGNSTWWHSNCSCTYFLSISDVVEFMVEVRKLSDKEISVIQGLSNTWHITKIQSDIQGCISLYNKIESANNISYSGRLGLQPIFPYTVAFQCIYSPLHSIVCNNYISRHWGPRSDCASGVRTDKSGPSRSTHAYFHIAWLIHVCLGKHKIYKVLTLS